MNIGDKDQLSAAFRDMAVALAAYREQLKQQGFSPGEILQLLINYQTALIYNAANKEEGPNG